MMVVVPGACYILRYDTRLLRTAIQLFFLLSYSAVGGSSISLADVSIAVLERGVQSAVVVVGNVLKRE